MLHRYAAWASTSSSLSWLPPGGGPVLRSGLRDIDRPVARVARHRHRNMTKSPIISSHDWREVAAAASRVAIFERGNTRLIESPNPAASAAGCVMAERPWPAWATGAAKNKRHRRTRSKAAGGNLRRKLDGAAKAAPKSAIIASAWRKSRKPRRASEASRRR